MQDEVVFVWTGCTIPSRANTLSCQLSCDGWCITVAGLLFSVTAAAFTARETRQWTCLKQFSAKFAVKALSGEILVAEGLHVC